MSSLNIEIENKVYRKVIFRIMPLLLIGYCVAYLDRVNVGFAKLQMSSALNFSEAVYGLGAGLFFLGYFIFEIPSNIFLRKFGAKVWIARIMITWSIISMSFAFVQNEWQFYVLRFLLGLSEAGFYPGVILYLTYWFPSHRRSKMFAVFNIGAPISGIFGSLVSGYILDTFHNFQGWQGWQWLFVIEAIPSFILGIIVIFYLDSSVRSVKWLNDSEKQIIEEDIKNDSLGKSGNISFSEILKNKMVWLLSFIYFLFIMGEYGLALWMPTFIQSLGVESNITIGILGSLPFIMAVFSMFFVGYSSDKFRERRWHIVIPALISSISFITAPFVENNLFFSIIALSIATGAIYAFAPIFWSLPTAMFSGTTVAIAIAFINSIGNLSGFVGPYMIGLVREITGSSNIAMFILAGSFLLGSTLILKFIPAKLVNH